MHTLDLVKPDGRRMSLYSRRPIAGTIAAPSPRSTPVNPDPHFRWHPLRREWVDYAAYRQTRTFLPPPEYNPLRPADDAANPTELPLGDYDIAVFDNLFPAMSLAAPAAGESIVPTAAGHGHCEVVVFTQDPGASLATLDTSHVALLMEVWGRRTEAIAARSPEIEYVLAFENRGAEVGVTLHHPHGQLYAYPFIPPVPMRMHQSEREHFELTGETLLASLIEAELRDGRRIVHVSDEAVAFVPAWARYPYEVWVAPRQQVPDFAALQERTREALARALLTVLRQYDGLWQMRFPYIMAWYQAPRVAGFATSCHLHAELLPAYRMPGRLKYLAGTEIAAGMFANDTLPEEKAAELRAVAVNVD